MKEEQRPTLSALDHFNADAIDADCLYHRSSAGPFVATLSRPWGFCHRAARGAPTIVSEELCGQLSCALSLPVHPAWDFLVPRPQRLMHPIIAMATRRVLG
jgi:hypothetical protein